MQRWYDDEDEDESERRDEENDGDVRRGGRGRAAAPDCVAATLAHVQRLAPVVAPPRARARHGLQKPREPHTPLCLLCVQPSPHLRTINPWVTVVLM